MGKQFSTPVKCKASTFEEALELTKVYVDKVLQANNKNPRYNFSVFTVKPDTINILYTDKLTLKGTRRHKPEMPHLYSVITIREEPLDGEYPEHHFDGIDGIGLSD